MKQTFFLLTLILAAPSALAQNFFTTYVVAPKHANIPQPDQPPSPVKITEYHVDTTQVPAVIEGTAVNVSGRKLASAAVYFVVYDNKGNVLDPAHDNTYALDPGAVWYFKATGPLGIVASAKVAQVNASIWYQ